MSQHQTKEIQSGNADSGLDHQVRKIANSIPWILAALFGVFWSTTYLFLGVLHGMWPMFDSEFPFLIAHLLGLHIGHLSIPVRALLVFADGGLIGFVLAWLAVRFFSGRYK